jgi:hypothetical protein
MTRETISERLEQLAARRADQDKEFAAVCSDLAALDERSLLQVSHDWTEAMNEATHVAERMEQVPVGALRG